MKKICFYIGVVLLICLYALPVKASEYDLNKLIPIDTKATVHTDRFDYIDFSFSSEINEKGNGVIHFTTIQNNMVTKTPVSINILLFDQDKINIGFLTYCSDRDFDSKYSAFKLKGNESTAFAIDVFSKYFVSEKSAKDVSYIAAMDENAYCQVGGYTKYAGLKIEQIVGGEGTETKEQTNYFKIVMDAITSFLQSSLFKIILIGIGIICLLIVFGSFLNTLYQRMYTHKTILVFVPIANIYITVKLVFGNIVAVIYAILLVTAVVLYFFGVHLFLYIMGALWALCLLLVVVKILTKKYDLFYFEPAMDSSQYGDTSVKKKPTKKEEDKKSLLVKDEEAIDLSYHDQNTHSAEEAVSIDHILESLENPDGTDDKI